MARFDRTIPPGGEGTITLEVNTEGLQDNIHETARVFTNDTEAPELIIGMRGNVWASIRVHPKHVVFTGIVGEKTGTVVHLEGQKEDPLTLRLISVSIPDKVEVELKETEKGRTWELEIDNKVKQKTNYEGKVKLTTNYPEKPELVIRFSGNIIESVETRAEALSIGRMSGDRFHQQLKAKGTRLPHSEIVIVEKVVSAGEELRTLVDCQTFRGIRLENIVDTESVCWWTSFYKSKERSEDEIGPLFIRTVSLPGKVKEGAGKTIQLPCTETDEILVQVDKGKILVKLLGK